MYWNHYPELEMQSYIFQLKSKLCGGASLVREARKRLGTGEDAASALWNSLQALNGLL